MTDRLTIHVGMNFYHARFIDGVYKPVRCTVTAVRRGMVYYSLDGGKHGHIKTPIEDFHASVGRLADD